VTDGKMPRPADYYSFENLSTIGSYRDELCGDPVVIEGCNTPIELVDGQIFESRCQTHIESLKPKNKPIAKLVGMNFEFAPADMGSVKLNYKRVPVFGKILVKHDPVYNEDVPDTDTSTNYEWPEFARRMLVWFISQQYGVANREQALTQQLQVEGKTVRG
jgi:hypothetical protein